MRVLFITVAPIGSVAAAGIYTDLLRELRDNGHQVYVVSPAEGEYGLRPGCDTEDGIHVVRVSTGDVTRSRNMVAKGLSTLLMESRFLRAIKRYFREIRFDLVLYTSPPVNIDRLVGNIRRHTSARTYLMLKDIFPQNAVDLGLMRADGLLWRYFRRREKALYAVSDTIGCMSEANVRYLLRHNPEIDPARVEVCPNAISPVPYPIRVESREKLRASLGASAEDLLLVYGGNLGLPQGVDFLLDVIDNLQDWGSVCLLIVGAGTEYERIEEHLARLGSARVRLLPSIPRDEFTKVLAVADVGLIFLDKRFTIPNFPSRLTAYLEAGIPVIAATDPVSDLAAVLEGAGCGIGVRSGDMESFAHAVSDLLGDRERLHIMGLRGRELLEAEYTAARCYEVIASHLETTSGDHGNVTVRCMNAGDIEDVVGLHMVAMQDFFLTLLGRPFLREYYTRLLSDRSAIAMVAVGAMGSPVGFVVGSTNPSGFYGRLLRYHWMRFALCALPAVLRSPRIVPRLVRALRYPGSQPSGDSMAGLYSIGVRPDLAGRGIGRRLVSDFLAEARLRGSWSVYLHADTVGNDHWNSLLQRMGWEMHREFITPEGRRMNEYWIDLERDRFE